MLSHILYIVYLMLFPITFIGMAWFLIIGEPFLAALCIAGGYAMEILIGGVEYR